MTGIERLNKAKEYFSKPAYTRLFRQAKKKYESIGRIGGKIRLSSLSEKEKEALSGLLARDIFRQKSVTIELSVLNEQLQTTRFSIDLLTLLSLLYGEEVKPKSVQMQEEQALWESFIDWLQSYAEEQEIRDWLEHVQIGKDSGYRMVKERFDESKEMIQTEGFDGGTIPFSLQELIDVVKGLNRLPIFSQQHQQSAMPLPIFAAKQTGDAHFFDRDHFAGRLLYYGIVHVNHSQVGEDKQEENAVFSREQYRNVGIKLDDLSSQVLISGLWNGEEYSYALTFRMLERIINTGNFYEYKWFKTALTAKKIFVSENPSICTMILDKLYDDYVGKRVSPPIVCTSGQPSHAALKLFDLLADQGVKLHYSGDLDVKGIAMAQMLHLRYPGNFQPWGMTNEAIMWWREHTKEPLDGYGLPFSDDELNLLGNMNLSWDEELVEALLESKTDQKPIKIFQEMLVQLLWAEYEKSFI